jgi:hypothetical protein
MCERGDVMEDEKLKKVIRNAQIVYTVLSIVWVNNFLEYMRWPIANIFIGLYPVIAIAFMLLGRSFSEKGNRKGVYMCVILPGVYLALTLVIPTALFVIGMAIGG